MGQSNWLLSAKDVSVFGWGKRRWVLLFLLLFFSLFPIFLSGVGIGVSVLGFGFWGFCLLPSFFGTI